MAFECKKCGKKLTVEVEYALSNFGEGGQVRCPACGFVVEGNFPQKVKEVLVRE